MQVVNKKTKAKKRTAFTLIELLIVVAIIGILAAIAVPNFQNAQMRAKLSQITSNFKALSTAIMMYNSDHGVYPLHDPSHNWNCPGVSTPVAYIARVPWDIFQDVMQGDRMTSQVRDPEMHPEPLYTTSGGAYGQPSLDKGIPEQGTGNDLTLRFIMDVEMYQKARNQYPNGRYLVSVGPDQAHNYPGVYRSSNGLRSTGDMIWVVP